ncbi:MAG: hypothetical protein ORN49_08895, partial [Rhodobacteraceae bacterium]|nr:hypothetical protein [Paracoccaceae bacterium]
DGLARILFSPTSLPTAGWTDSYLATFPAAATTTAEERAIVNAEVSAHFSDHGVTFLPQPEDSVTEGCFTRRDYASETIADSNDHEHKNPAYGARVLAAALVALKTPARLEEAPAP